MTFSIFSERSALVFCSPSTHRMESTTFDFPHPLGPTIPVIPSSKLITILSAKLLNPLISSFASCMKKCVSGCCKVGKDKLLGQAIQNKIDYHQKVCSGAHLSWIPVFLITFENG